MTSPSLLRTEWKYIIRTLEILVITMGTLFLFRIFILDLSVVDQNSMEPTLHPDDIIVVEKLTGFFREFNRGDIIQLFNPDDQSIIVKRVIGLPGEAVSSMNGEIYIVKPDGTSEKFNETSVITDQRLFTSRGLHKDEYFVLGDNRRGSTDSRIFGPVHRSDIIGRIMAVWRPNREKK